MILFSNDFVKTIPFEYPDFELQKDVRGPKTKNTFVSCKRNAGDVLPCSPSNSNPFAQNFNNPELPKHISQISFQKPSLYCYLFICSDFVMDYLQTRVLDEASKIFTDL